MKITSGKLGMCVLAGGILLAANSYRTRQPNNTDSTVKPNIVENVPTPKLSDEEFRALSNEFACPVPIVDRYCGSLIPLEPREWEFAIEAMKRRLSKESLNASAMGAHLELFQRRFLEALPFKKYP